MRLPALLLAIISTTFAAQTPRQRRLGTRSAPVLALHGLRFNSFYERAPTDA